MSGGFSQKLAQLLRSSLSITKNYFKARLLICLVLGALSALAFWLLKFPAFWLLGLVVAAGNIVPMFGPWISAAVVAVILLISEGPAAALWSLCVVLATQALDEFVLTPLLLKRAVDLKPLTIVAVVIAAGSLLGFWGILFALPIAATIKVAYNIFLAPPPKQIDAGAPEGEALEHIETES